MTTGLKYGIGAAALFLLYKAVDYSKTPGKLSVTLLDVAMGTSTLQYVEIKLKFEFGNPSNYNLKIRKPYIRIFDVVNNEKQYLASSVASNDLLNIAKNSQVQEWFTFRLPLINAALSAQDLFNSAAQNLQAEVNSTLYPLNIQFQLDVPLRNQNQRLSISVK